MCKAKDLQLVWWREISRGSGELDQRNTMAESSVHACGISLEDRVLMCSLRLKTFVQHTESLCACQEPGKQCKLIAFVKTIISLPIYIKSNLWLATREQNTAHQENMWESQENTLGNQTVISPTLTAVHKIDHQRQQTLWFRVLFHFRLEQVTTEYSRCNEKRNCAHSSSSVKIKSGKDLSWGQRQLPEFVCAWTHFVRVKTNMCSCWNSNIWTGFEKFDFKQVYSFFSSSRTGACKNWLRPGAIPSFVHCFVLICTSLFPLSFCVVEAHTSGCKETFQKKLQLNISKRFSSVCLWICEMNKESSPVN